MNGPKVAAAPDREGPHAGLAIEGEAGACTVGREWSDGAALEAAEGWVELSGRPRAKLTSLGWREALTSHRPFLSYRELGSMLDAGPSQLYDAPAKILGLDDLVDAQDALQKERKVRQGLLERPERPRGGLHGVGAPPPSFHPARRARPLRRLAPRLAGAAAVKDATHAAAAKAFEACKRGTRGDFDVDLPRLVEQAERLAHWLQGA